MCPGQVRVWAVDSRGDCPLAGHDHSGLNIQRWLVLVTRCGWASNVPGLGTFARPRRSGGGTPPSPASEDAHATGHREPHPASLQDAGVFCAGYQPLRSWLIVRCPCGTKTHDRQFARPWPFSVAKRRPDGSQPQGGWIPHPNNSSRPAKDDEKPSPI